VEGEDGFKNVYRANGLTSLRLELKVESKATEVAGGCLWYITWGLRFSVRLLMVLFTLLWFASWSGLVLHTFGFYFKLNVNGRCVPAA